MNCFTDDQLNRISHLIREIERLSDAEKLFLYLQLPCGRTEGNDGKSKFNTSKSDIFSKKPDQETTQTYTWILSHLEVDPNVSLPKQEVYDEYRAFCQANRFEPLCVADFGKAMKHAFPCIKPRRLGQRGNSRYCYSGLRKKYRIQPPNLPDLIEPTFCIDNDCSQAYNQIIEGCREYPDDCPIINQPDMSTYDNGVINLKIEPNSNYSSSTSSGGSSSSEQQHDNNNHSNANSANQFNLGTCENSDKLAASQRVVATTELASATPVINEHNHFVQQQQQSIPTQMQLPNQSARFSYGFIQQPGSPDDDDYRHNYQDFGNCLPLNGQLFSFAPSSFPPTPSSSGPPSVGSFANNQIPDNSKTPQQSGSTIDDRGGLQLGGNIRHASAATRNHLIGSTNGLAPSSQNNQNHHHHHHQQQQQQVINFDNAPQIHQANNILQHNSAHHNHFVSTHMTNTAHFESCASPFQSPASTPYPMMANSSTNHMNHHDMQDYYSNDFVRYSNS